MFDCGPAATHKLVKAGSGPPRSTTSSSPTTTSTTTSTTRASALPLGPGGRQGERAPGVRADRRPAEFTRRSWTRRSARSPTTGSRGSTPRRASRSTSIAAACCPGMPPTVGTHDVGPGLVHERRGWKVTAAPADHVQPWLDSLAYRLDSPEGSVVFTGDTQPCDTVIELAKGADVMLCMCWDDQEIMNAERRERRPVRHHRCRRDGPGGRRQEAGALAHGATPLRTARWRRGSATSAASSRRDRSSPRSC